ADRDALRAALADGTVDAIASDHAPHTREEKEREWALAPDGVIGLETTLPVVYTDLVEAGVIPLPRAIELLTIGPARSLGIAGGAAAPVKADPPARSSPSSAERLLEQGRLRKEHGDELAGRLYDVLEGQAPERERPFYAWLRARLEPDRAARRQAIEAAEAA